jgi:hypothetical protein
MYSSTFTTSNPDAFDEWWEADHTGLEYTSDPDVDECVEDLLCFDDHEIDEI